MRQYRTNGDQPMRLSALLAAAMLFTVAEGASAQDPDPPMFAAFKKFCVETDAKPAAVKAAVEAAGGRLRQPPGVMGGPMPATVWVWDYRVGAVQMTVNAGTMRFLMTGPGDDHPLESCSIFAGTKDDESVAAIRTWVGVPPIQSDPVGEAPVHGALGGVASRIESQTSLMFDFQQVAGVRSPLPIDDNAWSESVAKGQAWELVLMGDDNVRLTHFLPNTHVQSHVLSVLEDGNLRLDQGAEFDVGHLSIVLGQVSKERPRLDLFLHIAKGTDRDAIERVLRALQRKGITNVGLTKRD